MTPATPTVNGWTWDAATRLVESGTHPDGTTPTDAEFKSADAAIALMKQNGVAFGVPGAVQSYLWPAAPPCAPPQHQAVGALKVIADSGINVTNPLETQAYVGCCQRADDHNFGQTVWGDYSGDYASAAYTFEQFPTAYPALPAHPMYWMAPDFKTYHETWNLPMPGQQDISRAGGAEPPYTIVPAPVTGIFNYGDAVNRKASAMANNSAGASIANLPAEQAAAKAAAPVVDQTVTIATQNDRINLLESMFAEFMKMQTPKQASAA